MAGSRSANTGRRALSGSLRPPGSGQRVRMPALRRLRSGHQGEQSFLVLFISSLPEDIEMLACAGCRFWRMDAMRYVSDLCAGEEANQTMKRTAAENLRRYENGSARFCDTWTSGNRMHGCSCKASSRVRIRVQFLHCMFARDLRHNVFGIGSVPQHRPILLSAPENQTVRRKTAYPLRGTRFFASRSHRRGEKNTAERKGTRILLPIDASDGTLMPPNLYNDGRTMV